MCCISSCTCQYYHLIRQYGAIAFHACFNAYDGLLTYSTAAQLILARVGQRDRTLCCHGEERAEIFQYYLLRYAKTASHTVVDHADAPQWQVEKLGQCAPDVVWCLVCRVDDQVSVLIIVGNCTVVLKRCCLSLDHDVFA